MVNQLFTAYCVTCKRIQVLPRYHSPKLIYLINIAYDAVPTLNERRGLIERRVQSVVSN